MPTWIREEDKILLEEWNEVTSRTLVQRLPRHSAQGCYDRARHLGLRAGPPQGMVSVKSLSEDSKWGYDYYATLRILRDAGVTVKIRNNSSPNPRSRGVRYVDPDDAHEAAALWEKRRSQVETVKQAATRIGMASHTLWEWVTLEGLVPPKKYRRGGTLGGAGRTFTALPEVYDRVNKKYRLRRLPNSPAAPKTPSPRLGRESPKMAAIRLHVRDFTVRGWLTEEGLLPPVVSGERCHYYADPEVYDKLAAKYRTGRNAPKGPRHPPDADDSPAERSSTKMAGALPATMTPPPA